MASPAELAQTLPETLPEDFGDWDNGDSKDTAPGFGDAPKPSPQPDAPQATVGLQADKPNEAPPPSPTAVDPDDGTLPHQQNSISTAADRLPSSPSRRQGAAHTTSEVSSPPVRQEFDVEHGSRNKPEFEATAIRGDDQSLVRPLRSNIIVKEKQKTARNKWIMVGAVSACSILALLFLMVRLFNSGTRSNMAKQHVEPRPAATDMQPKTNTLEPRPAATDMRPKTNTLKPSASRLLDPKSNSAATESPQNTDNEPSTEEEVNPAQVQSRMMNDQLKAPVRIPQDLRRQNVEPEPPAAGFGAAGTEGLGGSGAIGSVFSGQARSIVKAATPNAITVSAGVATGLLIHKTTPVYPPIAKAAYVSGIVMLQGTISKTGTVQDLKVVSGPVMLRQPALDAVRTWRYKPYSLNNQATEVQTTISVPFSLDR